MIHAPRGRLYGGIPPIVQYKKEDLVPYNTAAELKLQKAQGGYPRRVQTSVLKRVPADFRPGFTYRIVGGQALMVYGRAVAKVAARKAAGR